MENNFFQVVCIKKCKTFGGAHFIKNKSYKCHIIDEYAYIYNEDNDMIKIEVNPKWHKFGFSTYFSSLKELRKLKLNKINKLKYER